jgi:acetolactate synthase-1/2/3 large subunit
MENILSVEDGAEAFIELLNANSVDYIFLNPGTASGSIQEALSKYKALGKQAPKIITSLHEYVALSAAHGYFMVSGKPQVVLVHLALGTLQLGGALLNAQRGRAGVVICATRVPSDREGKRIPSFSLNWIHEEFDQAAPVRDYVKWEYELRSTETIQDVVQRAFQMVTTEPCGPAYIVLPQDLISERIKEVHIPPVIRHAPASAPQVDTTIIEKTAEMLIQSEVPLIITGYSGKHPEAVPALVELAETLGARVVTAQYYMNFPTTHPLFGGFGAEPYLKDADVIFVIDHDIPYIPARANIKPDARLIHFDIDIIKKDFPLWNFAADILAECDSSKALPLLSQVIRQKLTSEDKARFQARFSRLKDEHQKQLERRPDFLVAKEAQKAVPVDLIGRNLAELIDDDTIVVEEAVTSSFAVLQHLQRTKPGTFFRNEGASLGWGLGAALGAKLASPESTVVSLVGDGTFIFGGPIPTFWAANVYHAPFLCIVFNNSMYNAPRMGVRGADGGQSYSEKTGVWVGSDIKPSPDYALVAQACGGYGRVVENSEDLKPVLTEALEQVHQGKAAVVDVRIG